MKHKQSHEVWPIWPRNHTSELICWTCIGRVDELLMPKTRWSALNDAWHSESRSHNRNIVMIHSWHCWVNPWNEQCQTKVVEKERLTTASPFLQQGKTEKDAVKLLLLLALSSLALLFKFVFARCAKFSYSTSGKKLENVLPVYCLLELYAQFWRRRQNRACSLSKRHLQCTSEPLTERRSTSSNSITKHPHDSRWLRAKYQADSEWKFGQKKWSILWPAISSLGTLQEKFRSTSTSSDSRESRTGWVVLWQLRSAFEGS